MSKLDKKSKSGSRKKSSKGEFSFCRPSQSILVQPVVHSGFNHSLTDESKLYCHNASGISKEITSLMRQMVDW